MKKINVLSLFDGLAGARIALDKLGIPYNYYASEIDKYAISVAQKNYPNIVQLGDIVKLGKENPYPKEIVNGVDLIIFGSPCTDLSIAKKNRQGLKGNSSKLFFEAVRIMKEIPHKYFLMENVASMSKESKNKITEILGVESILINSSLLSAQNRHRLYWFGKLVNEEKGIYEKVEVMQPEDKHIYLKDILETECTEKLKSYCIDANYFKGTNLEHYLKKKVRQVVFEKTEKIGQIGKNGQSNRVYDMNGKSVTLSANGGGWGAKTGLYVIPHGYIKEQIKGVKKYPTLCGQSPQSKHMICVAQRGRYNLDGSTSQKMEPRFDRKTNTFSSHQKDNYVCNIGDKEFVIRKLTPFECEKLQTIPENFTAFGIRENREVKISNTQRYKMIGNGFTVDVIKHILSFANFK